MFRIGHREDAERVLVAYGYRPGRAVILALAMIGLLGLFFEQTWVSGNMAPAAAPVLISKPWISATVTHPENPGAFWASPGQAGQDYETFHAFAYAADLVVPIVNFWAGTGLGAIHISQLVGVAWVVDSLGGQNHGLGHYSVGCGGCDGGYPSVIRQIALVCGSGISRLF